MPLTRVTIDVIFVINRNFLNKYSENQKILTNKMSFILNFAYAVQFSLRSVKKKMSDVIIEKGIENDQVHMKNKMKHEG